MGFFGTRSTNTGSTNRERGAAKNRTQTVSKKAKAKVKTDRAKDNSNDFKNMKYEGSKAPSILARGLDYLGISNKSFEVNKAYYEKNVVGKNNFTASPEDFKKYMTSRGSGSVDALGRPTNNVGNDNKSQGIELAKAATGTATVKGPKEIQKDAANTTVTKMSAGQINIANKRKGRIKTNITAKKTLDKNYKLSEKTLLG